MYVTRSLFIHNSVSTRATTISETAKWHVVKLLAELELQFTESCHVSNYVATNVIFFEVSVMMILAL